MKKFKTFVALSLALLLALVGVIAGCSRNSLDVPFGIDIDQDNNMTWEEVDGARSYKIEIKSLETQAVDETSTRKTEFSLSSLEEGDYEIRIMAIGGSQSSVFTSPWTEAIAFHKDFETGLIYDLVGDEYHIKRAGSASGSVTIEDYYRGKPVTAIDGGAFRASLLVTDLVIGNNVRSIGENAFYQCTGLQSVTFPESLTNIGTAAFQGCNKLQSIVLPDHVSELPERAFAYCRALTDITFGEGLEYIGVRAFFECSALERVAFSDSVAYIDEEAFASDEALVSVSFGSGIEYIGIRAFSPDPLLEEVTFSALDGALTIESYAFYGCEALKELDIPEGTVCIKDYAFHTTSSLERISIPDSLTEMGTNIIGYSKLWLEQYEDTGIVYADNWISFASNDIRSEITELAEPTIQEGTRGIANRTFANSGELQRVTLPASVKYLGRQAFYGCSKLFYVRSPKSGLVKIDYSAFAYCGQLSRVLLNDGLLEIGSYAFYECTVLNNVEFAYDGTLIPATVMKVGQGAFEGTLLWGRPDEYGVIYADDWVVGYSETRLMSSVELKEDVFGIADYAFSKAEKLQNISGLNNVERLGRGAFYLCNHLGAVSLNRNLEAIEPFTFYKCTALYDIGDLPWSLKEIGDYAFYVCSTLKSLDLYDTSVTKVGSHAFYGCTNLQELYLSDALEILDAYAFYGTAIHRLEIPDSVTTLGERAFGRCYNLTNVSFGGSIEEIGEFAFRECIFLSNIVLPDSLKKISDYAFYGCTGIRSVTFGNSVEYIGKYAFANAERLSVLDLPASLDYIGANAFKGCNLKVVVMHGPVAYVGQYAFFGAAMTLYTADVVGGEWDALWNEQVRPVLQNCVFDEEDGHLVSVTINENTILNGYIWGGIGAPYRAGYEFIGWTSQQGSHVADYGMNDLLRVPVGTTLYAVWQRTGETESDDAFDEEDAGEPAEALSFVKNELH